MEKTNKNIENAANKAASNELKNEAKATVKNPAKNEAKPEAQPTKAPEKTAEEREKEIKQRTEELQKCLQELQRKQELSTHRTVFIETLDQLAEAEKRLNDEEEFDSRQIKVKFVDYYNYRETEVFTIGNKSIIKDFIEFTREKIKIRIADIEQQLVG